MKKFWNQFSLRQKASFYGLVLLCYFSISAFVLYTQGRSLNDLAYYVNASGKTRMLSQRIMGQTILYLKDTSANRQINKEKLIAALKEHELCSNFLINGGQVIFSTDKAIVKPVLDESIRDSARKAKALFEIQTKAIQSLLDSETISNESFRNNETLFIENFSKDILLKNNIRVTDLFQHLATKTRLQFERSLFIIGIIGLIIVVLLYLISFSYFTSIVNSLRAIKFNLTQMGLLSKYANNTNSKDELKSLNEDFTNINTNLNEINSLANELSKGNFDVFTLNKTIKENELKSDNLIHSLENMRVQLKKLTEDERNQRVEMQNMLSQTEEVNEELLAKEEALELSNKLLADNNEYLEAFNNGLAHDLKNHAGNILSMVTLLKKYIELNDIEKIKTITLKLNKSTEQFLSILNGFMYLSKSETYLEKSPTELTPEILIDTIHTEIEYLKDDDNASITYDLAFNNFIYSKHFLKIILVNLISNSIKYKKPTVKAEVLVKVWHTDNQLNISVQDNGIGIKNDESKQKLFKLFSRLSNEGSNAEGSGIGLFLIRKIVERKQGKIWYESQFGVGSTFYVQIPIQ